MNITYGNIKINDLFVKIKNGSLTVPSFQRGFDWTTKDITRLYNSIVLKSEPFGSVVIWEDTDNSKAIQSDSKIFKQLSVKVSDTTKTYLIDGQQRVTSFLMAYIWHLKSGASHISRVKKVWYDVETGKFVSKEKQSKWLIPSHIFFKETRVEFLKSVVDILKNSGLELSSEKMMDTAEAYINLNNIDAGTITISSNDLNEVIDVFTLINTKGKKLTPFNIVHANYVANEKNYNLASEYKKIVNKLNDSEKRWDINSTTLLIFHYSILHNTISNKEIMDLSSIDVTKDMTFIKDSLEKLLEQTISELEEMGYKSFDMLPSDKFLYLVGAVVYENNLKNLNAKETGVMNKWFKSAVINERYSSGADGAKINGFKKDKSELLNMIKFEFDKPTWAKRGKFELDDITQLKYGATSLEYKYIVSRMIKFIPSISTGKLVKKTSNKMKNLNLHHIFPQGHPDFSKDDNVESVANLTPLEANDNLKISNDSPKIYMKNIPYKSDEQLISPNETFDDLKKFVNSRAKMILDKLNNEWE